jgi:surface protein
MAFIGIVDKARPVSQVYIGVNGVARLVTGAFVGVDGIAQLWFGSNVGGVVGDLPMLAPGRQWFKDDRFEFRDGNIEIVDSYEPDGSEYSSWAADVDGTGSIMCYLYTSESPDPKKTNPYDKVIIAGNGSGMIAANPNSALAFIRTIPSDYTVTGLNLLDTSAVVNMNAMLSGIANDISAQVKGWKTGIVNNMLSLFGGCSGITSLDLSGWDVSQATNMSQMFHDCNALTTLNLNGWNTSSVTNMSDMFSYCESLLQLDIGHFDTGLVTDMSGMFYNCSALTALRLNSWNTNSLTDIYCIFYGCSNLNTLEVSNWNVKNVTLMSKAFGGIDVKVIDLRKWNTASVHSVGEASDLFTFNNSLEEVIVSKDTWTIDNIEDYVYSGHYTGCANIGKIKITYV